MEQEEFIKALEVSFRRAVHKLRRGQSINDLLPLLRSEVACELWEYWLRQKGYPV